MAKRCKHCKAEIIKDSDGVWVHIQRGVVPNPDYLHRTCILPRTYAEPADADA